MCRFVRDGEPDIGEYRELADGTGICVLADMNGDSEEDRRIPAGRNDARKYFRLGASESADNHAWAGIRATDAGGIAERMARTDFIIEEYKTGILDEHEAGAELFHHLFPNEH